MINSVGLTNYLKETYLICSEKMIKEIDEIIKNFPEDKFDKVNHCLGYYNGIAVYRNTDDE